MKIYKNYFAIIIILSLTFSYLSSIKAAESVTFNSANLGRTYDGLGGLESYGKLLFDYPEQQRNEILDYLFLPNYGAALQILKMTIGCDGNDAGGSWPSHRRSLDETPNYNRGYGWWMMKEAKKRNPNIQLSALNWGYPGYATTDELKAQFIFEYVKGAKDVHGLILDHIGGNQNESEIMPGVTKLLRQSWMQVDLEV
jgi:galactosylceramidase